MAEDKQLDVELQICLGIARLGELDPDDKLITERMAALFELSGRIKWYLKEFCNNPLALDICAQKIDYIMQAKSKKDLNEILSPPKIHYNGNEVVPVGKYHVEAEELMIWSYTSLWSGGPLNDVGFKRYMKLMCKFFPEFAEEL